MSARCPEGHLSHDPDYCDHCGIRIVAGQDSYGYRPEEPAGRGAAPGSTPSGGYGGGAGGGSAGGGDAYGRRGYGEGGGADPLGIRRAPTDARGVADPPRGGYPDEPPPARAGGGYVREGYGGGYGEPEARPAPAPERGYAEDPYGGETLSRRRGAERPEFAQPPGGGYEQQGYPAREDYGQNGYSPQPDYARPVREEAPAPGRHRGTDPYGGYGAPDPLAARGAAAPAPSVPDTRLVPCPNCRTPHEPGARFCDTCGMDFATGHVPGPADAVPLAPPAPSRVDDRRGGGGYADPPPRVDDRARVDPRVDPRIDPRADDRDGYADPRRAPARGRGWEDSRGGAPAVATSWEAVVEAERDYYDSGDDHRVPFPAFYPRRVFALTGPELLVGRRSDSRGIHPEIDLSGAPEDPGISRAHAMFEQMPDGSYAVRDPGSTNGTRLNDEPEPIEAGQPIPLRDGDRVYLGAWTRITVRAR